MIQLLTGSTEVQSWINTTTILKILDLRPRSSAIANRTGGYGYENTSNYPGSSIQFCNIGNIHAVRDAYQKMTALCHSPTTTDLQWNASLEDTKWLGHIRLILAASWESAYWVQIHRLPVLIHCSHGWDRTSQVAALAELLLDPYYRTRWGFCCLLEKDFMSFGHPFHTRCAHGEGRGDSNNNPMTDEGQISPIFLQFLDCVFQIVDLYPECFEFNTKYLLELCGHVYSCRFGNFLCDTERERELVAGIRQRTHSLWDYLDTREDCVNKEFDAEKHGGVLLMPLPTLLRNVKLWEAQHCMNGPKPTQRWPPGE
jgi:myotubularin-related protein 1/2